MASLRQITIRIRKQQLLRKKLLAEARALQRHLRKNRALQKYKYLRNKRGF